MFKECVAIPFILDVRLVDAPAGVTQKERHTGFLHLPSAVLASIFIAGRIQPSLSLVDCEVEFCFPTNQSFSTWAFLFIFCVRRKIPVRVTAPRFELTSQRQKVSRLPTEPPGRPVAAAYMHRDASMLQYVLSYTQKKIAMLSRRKTLINIKSVKHRYIFQTKREPDQLEAAVPDQTNVQRYSSKPTKRKSRVLICSINKIRVSQR